MKSIRFSFRRAAVLASALLLLSLSFGLTSCKTDDEDNSLVQAYLLTQQDSTALTANEIEPTDPIIASWVSSYNETYEITTTKYNNYYSGSLYYKTSNVKIRKLDAKSGYIYGQFTDENYLGYGASVNQWYALYYQFGDDYSTVCFGQPYKNNGKAATDTLKEAIYEFTLENDYYNLSSLSACTKQ